jgi:hypothetical protein
LGQRHEQRVVDLRAVGAASCTSASLRLVQLNRDRPRRGDDVLTARQINGTRQAPSAAASQ